MSGTMQATLTTGRRVLRRLGQANETQAAVALLLLLTYFLLTAPSFGSMDTATSILGRATTYGLPAVAVTIVLVQGELDLSVGSVLSLASCLTIGLQPHGTLIAIAVPILVSAALGTLNGIIVTKGRINSFIATLGTMIAIQGLAYIYLPDGSPVSGSNISQSVSISSPFLGFLTPHMLVVLIVSCLAAVFLRYSWIGRQFYAIGGNRQAALGMGIPVERRLWLGFTLSSALAGLAGVTAGIELNSGSAILGLQTPLIAIATAVVGGAALTGGSGSVSGTLLGVLILSTLGTGLFLAGVDPSVQQVITGGILIFVVLVDRLRRGHAGDEEQG
jgi:ribose transport system permease protein